MMDDERLAAIQDALAECAADGDGECRAFDYFVGLDDVRWLIARVEALTPAPVDDDRLAAIEAKLAAATPGPWIWENDGDGRTLVTADDGVVGGAVLWAKDDNHCQVDLQMIDEDAALIASARADLRYLVARARQLDALADAVLAGRWTEADEIARRVKGDRDGTSA